MIGLGTIVNVMAIIIGGIIGRLVGNRFSDSVQDSLLKANGLSVMFIGISGTMARMMNINDGALGTQRELMVVVSLCLGTMLGEWLRLEDRIENFGHWLKKKTGSSKDQRFVIAFVSTSLTVCIGAMAIVGSLQDGLYGDSATLMIKSLLDFITVMVLASSLGKGAIFSFIPVGLFQGAITLLARFVEPMMSNDALLNLGLVGNMLIFCVGVNLVWGGKFKTANMLPAILFAIFFAFFPLL